MAERNKSKEMGKIVHQPYLWPPQNRAGNTAHLHIYGKGGNVSNNCGYGLSAFIGRNALCLCHRRSPNRSRRHLLLSKNLRTKALLRQGAHFNRDFHELNFGKRSLESSFTGRGAF